MFALKILLRKTMIYRRNRMESHECLELSEKIQEAVCDLNEWKNAGSINIYKSTGNEVSTKDLIYEAERVSNKQVFYPTPKPRENMLDVDLVIVPGVVFDEKCARYGRGKGYYDRFLEVLPKKTIMIGIAYNFQVLPYKWKLKLNEFDIKMDMVLTEKRIIQKKGTFFY